LAVVDLLPERPAFERFRKDLAFTWEQTRSWGVGNKVQMSKSSRRKLLLWIGAVGLATVSAAHSRAVEPPVIPVGLDAYRQWDRWPYQRVGARAYMRSTYDRRGGNEGADASHFLYQLADDNNVALDIEGAGVLYFARYNHWHGSPWRYVVDGTEHIVQETSTAHPDHPERNSVFMPQSAFPRPLAWSWADTQGADLSWVPIPFERSFRMGYSRTHYGTGYYIFHQYVRGAKLSHLIQTWNPEKAPDSDVLALLARAGSDISPSDAVSRSGSIQKLPPSETTLLFELTNAPSTLRKLSFSVPREQALAFGQVQLRITWDNRNAASVDAPIALFFGAGTLYNRDGRQFLVKAFPAFIKFDEKRVQLACFFPMPFFKSARLELIAAKTESVTDLNWNVAYQPLADAPAQLGYFHATYKDQVHPEPGKDLVLLDTRDAEGGGDWSGNFVGTSWTFSDRAVLGTLEGDPRFFFDDNQTPQAQGTGTEEWGGGGDYWGGLNMTLPFAGHPTGARNEREAKNDLDKIESAYRFLLADLMPFGKNALIRLEHGGENQSAEHYQTVTFWYGAPAAALIKTDELKIGDLASEKAHGYLSPQASPPYEISSRDEGESIQSRPQVGKSKFIRPILMSDEKHRAFQNLSSRSIRRTLVCCCDASWITRFRINAPRYSSQPATPSRPVRNGNQRVFGTWLERIPVSIPIPSKNSARRSTLSRLRIADFAMMNS